MYEFVLAREISCFSCHLSIVVLAFEMFSDHTFQSDWLKHFYCYPNKLKCYTNGHQ